MAKQPTLNPDPHAPATDDALAFRAAVRDVKPLAHATTAKARVKPATRRRLQKQATAPTDLDATMPLIHPDSAREEGASGGDSVAFQRSGVRIAVLRRLRRGLIPCDAELDLHGLSQLAARDRFAEFLDFSQAVGHRCVRIIHGKGYRSGARGPVLKIAVDLWLRKHPDVMAFTSARAIDGGTGALYVLLKG